MPVNKEAYHNIITELDTRLVTVVAVSKTKSVAEIRELYDLGHRDFGENYVQEMAEKALQLPKDIRWHFIGHLQRNKVKYIAPFVQLIQSVDSLKLLEEIGRQAKKQGRVIDCLLQVHIAGEETKFGLDEDELNGLISQINTLQMANVRILGLMGMASFTDDMEKVRSEFRQLKILFDRYTKHLPKESIGQTSPKGVHWTNLSERSPLDKLQTLSMGMSADYRVAIEEGSNMLRIGSLIFGERERNG